MKIGLYGNDRGANDVLDAVQKSAVESGMAVLRIPGMNNPVSAEMMKELSACDAIAFGVSTGATGFIEAQVIKQLFDKSLRLAQKIIVVEDFPGNSGWRDPVVLAWGGQLHLASIRLLPRDAPERGIYGTVHHVGYPDHWTEAMKEIENGHGMRTYGFALKEKGDECVTFGGEHMVYVSGFQNPVHEAEIIRQVQSLGTVDTREVLMHFRAHPGEVGRVSADTVRERDALLKDRWCISHHFTEGKHVDEGLIGLADVVIAHPGATSTFFCAELKKKIVCPWECLTADELSKTSYDYEQTKGRVHVVKRFADIPSAVTALADPASEESQALRKKQERSMEPFKLRGGYVKSSANVVEVIKQFLPS